VVASEKPSSSRACAASAFLFLSFDQRAVAGQSSTHRHRWDQFARRNTDQHRFKLDS